MIARLNNAAAVAVAIACLALATARPAPSQDEAPPPETTDIAGDSVYPYVFDESRHAVAASGGSGSFDIYVSVADRQAVETFIADLPFELATLAPWVKIEGQRIDAERGVIEVRYRAEENSLELPRMAVVTMDGAWLDRVPGARQGAVPKLTLVQDGSDAAKGAERRMALLGEPGLTERRFRDAAPVIQFSTTPQENTVLEEPRPKRAVSVGAVVSAASFEGPISPGQLISIFGADMASGLMNGAGLPLPRDFQGTRVEIGGVACPLLYVRADQINAQAPMETPTGNQEVRIYSPFGTATMRVNVVTASPELFRAGSSNQAIVQRNGVELGPSNPVNPGDILTFYGTGIGPLNLFVPSGEAARSGANLSRAALNAQMTIGGVNANLLFVGLTPGLVGVMQINAEAPSGMAGGGSVPVVLTIGGRRSRETFLSVAGGSGGGGGGNSGGGGGSGSGGTIFPSIRLGQTVNGMLSASDRRRIAGTGDAYADQYRLELSEETPIAIALQSNDFDTWINLYERNGSTDVLVSSDDDGGAGLNSSLGATLRSGVYTIEATSFSSDATGAYSLSVIRAGGGGGGGGADAPVIDNFSADSTSISAGSQTALRWSVRNASAVSISPGIGSVAVAGSVIVRPSTTTNYTLTASGPGGTRTATVTVGVGPAPGNTVTLEITNRLAYPVRVTVNGNVLGNVPAFDTASQTLTASSLSVSYELIRPTLGGRSLGDPISGFFDTINNPSGTVRLRVDNRFSNSDTAYFQPFVSNATAVDLLMEVNGGLQSQNRCNCTVPAFQDDTQFGYYRMFLNSNVRAYRSGSNYTGRYIYWGDGSNGVAAGRIPELAEPETGRVRLRATSAP